MLCVKVRINDADSLKMIIAAARSFCLELGEMVERRICVDYFQISILTGALIQKVLKVVSFCMGVKHVKFQLCACCFFWYAR